MSHARDEYAQNHPYRSLGLRFWLPWGVAVAANIAAFIAFIFFGASQLDQPLKSIAACAVAILFTLANIGLNRLPRRILEKRGLEEPLRPAYRRYASRLMPPMLLYVVLLFAATYYWKDAHPTGLVAVLVAIAPALPILFAIRAMMLMLKEESDEYLRLRMLQSWATATAITLGVCVVVGFLGTFKVVPNFPLWVVFPFWGVCMGLSQVLTGKRCA